MLPENKESCSRDWGRPALLLGGVALAALILGLPTLRGGFVGGDDHRLVIDHVLVNRPSVDHAIKLFTIVHRDLYQPLPLLMFSGEMALARAMNLFETGAQGGAWLFHLTNVVLHALVTVLVWRMVLVLDRRVRAAQTTPGGTSPALGAVPGPTAVATIAALLFAVHPINVETVAWVNGRMMLLSTLFALCGILAFVRWLDGGRPMDAVLVVVCVALSALSKVRVGLPVLLLLVAAIGRDWRVFRFWPVWIIAGLATGFFAWVNVGATTQADLFAEAAEHLQGPRAVRILLALDHYFRHLVWPTGLTSYYPTPPVVRWLDPDTIRAVLVVGFAMGFLAWCTWLVPAARWGVAWFFIALADTLPFVPARNVLGADRYLYLPLAGMFWALAASAAAVYTWWSRGSAVRTQQARRVAVILAAILTPLLIGMSWYTAHWYNTPKLKTLRVARVFSDTPRVWERHGWTLYSDGDYDAAIAMARREFVHDNPAVQSGALQLIGMSRFKQGHIDEALDTLHRAVNLDPESDLGKFRLGMVYEELGRFSEALPWYEACVASADTHNPTLHRLARVYREIGRPDDARRMYELELRNNPYEVTAIVALAELEFQEGTPPSIQSATRRLLQLLEWMPENIIARINLALVYDSAGQNAEAAHHFTRALEHGLESPEQAVLVHDYFEKSRRLDICLTIWTDISARQPENALARAFLAWTWALHGDFLKARQQISQIGAEARDLPMALATIALIALDDGRQDMVRKCADLLTSKDDAAARQRLLRALELFDERHPGQAWTYYLTSRLLVAQGNTEAAQAFARLFSAHCTDDTCPPARAELESLLPSVQHDSVP